ncbi:unnamed protein product [Cyclocybe aegerita]|uniref:Uncharacterized protein n=1 Tax=Cyclocybe aegerita TaxID=1973307 RepID=A0A8S0WJE3_CYCAE|nr:unnamed protein product [Cyclocybe aegerita]
MHQARGQCHSLRVCSHVQLKLNQIALLSVPPSPGAIVPTAATGDGLQAGMASPQFQADSPPDAESLASGPGPAEAPYSGMNQNTFILCNLLPSDAPVAGSYSRTLLGLGFGYPIWEPLANLDVPEPHQMRGVSIGDVGIVSATGNFAYGFNIFHSSEDPINLGCTPPNFVPLEFPEPSQLTRDDAHFPPMTILSSRTVEVTRVKESPIHISFSPTAKEGAALVLPHGGFREDVISTEHLRKYLVEHSLDWYQHLVHVSAALVHNASLYLVTGCDKTESWHMANLRGGSADFKEGSTKNGEIHYDWVRGANSRCRSMHLEDGDGRLFTLFVRGIKVALPNRVWRHKVEETSPEDIPYYDVLATSVDIYHAKVLRWLDYIAKGRNTWQSRREVPFHPFHVLARILHEESPHAVLSLMEDSIWTKHSGVMVDGSLREITRLLAKILASHDIKTVDKCVMFVPKPEPNPTQVKEPGLVQRIVGRIKWELTPEEKAAKRVAAILRRQS